MGAEYRLTPKMANRRVQVVSCVRQYIARYGASPSYREVAEIVGIRKSRVAQLIERAVELGELHRLPGARRGIALPGDRGEPLTPAETEVLIARLRAAGYKVDEDVEVDPLVAVWTNTTLPPLIGLEHIPDVDVGGSSHEGTEPG